MARNPALFSFSMTSLLVALMVLLPGCLDVEPADPDTYISTPHCIPTEWNGSIHWEAQYNLFMFKQYNEGFSWDEVYVELRWTGDGPFEMGSKISKDSGLLTHEPRAFFIDRQGPEDLVTRNDVIRIAGIGPDTLPLDVSIVWPDSTVSRTSVNQLPQATIAFGELTSTLVKDDESKDYRTILLLIESLYPQDAEIRWEDITVNVINPSNVRIYHNTSLSMRLNETRPLVTIPPPYVENPIPVAYFSNDSDPDRINPGDALYFPGLHRDMENSMVEVRWNGELIGRRILL